MIFNQNLLFIFYTIYCLNEIFLFKTINYQLNIYFLFHFYLSCVYLTRSGVGSTKSTSLGLICWPPWLAASRESSVPRSSLVSLPVRSLVQGAAWGLLTAVKNWFTLGWPGPPRVKIIYFWFQKRQIYK